MARARKVPVSEAQMEFTALSATVEPEEIEPTALDRQFGRFIARLEPNAVLEQAACLASAWRSAGHTCAPLERLGASAQTLLATRVVGAPGSGRPLILENGRLYLQRYWNYERQLADAIRARLGGAESKVNEAALERLLPVTDPDRQAAQRAAARAALESRFCVITGGPGTGKTRTVGIILALLRGQGALPRIKLAAPTGKAALRLTESIRGVLQSLAITWEMPLEALTLHRLLGVFPDAPQPRWDARHLLPVDAVIVDEASMIDLPMMAKLCAAVPSQARLILLGDKDQLASVETGHVLGDICAAGASNIRELRENFRFKGESGIQRLSELVNLGQTAAALALLRAPAGDDLRGAPLPSPGALPAALNERATEGFRAALETKDPATALEALTRFRLLCAVREGPYGVANLNRLTEAALARAGLIQPGPRHYAGRAVMILRNDYGLRLFNGDIGIVLPDAEGELRAWFRGDDGAVRALPPSRLPEHETAWAMTVHKSQGSEFERVLLILPDRENPVVTRELVYTAITRARQAVEVWYTPAVLEAAIARRTVRVGGLREKLSG